jgi:hypothetical protein
MDFSVDTRRDWRRRFVNNKSAVPGTVGYTTTVHVHTDRVSQSVCPDRHERTARSEARN